MLNTAPAWKYDHVGDYLTVIKKGLARCKGGDRVRMDWAGEPLDLGGFRQEFIKALHRRISLKVEQPPKMRKLNQNHQAALRRDQGRIRDIVRIRLRVYQFETKEAKARYSHLLASHDD